MNPDRWRQIEQVCHAALEREPGARAAFLDEACAGDAELRRDVESLLVGQSAARDFLETPAAMAAATASAPLGLSRRDVIAGGALSAGTRLGPYEITALVGAGGMGEVYKARDTRLNRTVAIKVLPPELTKDPERLRRFEQEARAVSTLNHPHIVTLHEFGTSGAGPYLVLEMIEGRSMGDLLRAGPLPVKRILAIGAQIADGLAKAHAAGIVHRDLKPDNVMVSDDGFAKILDFGLAKLVLPEFDASESDKTRSLAARTASGMILGTLGYMSPEQASGRPVDFRADHFALGALLYEMATAERPFRGGTAMESLAAVIHEEPVPVRSKRPDLPLQLGWLIERCLAKEPAERYASTRDLARDLADLRDHLSEIPRGELVGGPAPPQPWLRREKAAWVLAGIALAAAGALLMFRPQPSATSAAPVRATILPPPGLEFNLGAGIALSPDGARLAFRAGNTLWVRALDELTPKPLPGTDGAEYPFWSPDSRAIGFFIKDRLFRMKLEEASPTFVCDATAPRGGSWGADDVILFGSRTTVRKVSAAGGPVTDATSLEPQHFGHKWPAFLPDGRHFLYAANLREWKTAPLDLFLGSLDGTPARRLGESWSGPVFAEPGFVLSVTFPARTLVARRLDLANVRLESDSISITNGTSLTSQRWNAAVSAAATGRLVYVTGSDAPGRLVWSDRTGRDSEAMGPARYWDTTVSLDGRRAVSAIENDDRATADLWELDLERQTRTRRLTDTPDDEQQPILTHDGQEVFYGARRRGSVVDLFRRRLDAGSEENLVRALEGEGFPCAVSPDRKLLLYVEIRPGQDVYNLWLLPLDGGEPRPFQVDQYRKNCGPISRDGRWVLTTSRESGRAEVYVQPFPAGRTAYQVSKGALPSARPAWSPTGNEIYYFDERGRIMSVTVTFGQMPVPGNPQVLFEDGGTYWGFGVAGRTPVRFLRLLPDASAPNPSLTILTRWLPEKSR